METEKSCSTCKHRGASWPSRICIECYEKRPFEYMNWTPKEELVKEYVEKCLPGDNEATVTISKPSANAKQVAGKHYKDNLIQPWDYIYANNLCYFTGNCVKYVSRWRDKGGIGIKYQADENSLDVVAKGLAHAYGY